jgi:hypothetical protein
MEVIIPDPEVLPAALKKLCIYDLLNLRYY